jgi:hypothetical protein
MVAAFRVNYYFVFWALVCCALVIWALVDRQRLKF